MAKKFVLRNRKPAVELVTITGEAGLKRFNEECAKYVATGFSPVGPAQMVPFSGEMVFVQSFSRAVEPGSVRAKLKELDTPSSNFIRDRDWVSFSREEAFYLTYGRL